MAMAGPKFRFALLVGALVVAWWAYDVTSTYLLGERGLNFARYVNGVVAIAMAVAGGFMVVWAATAMLHRAERRRTGFESQVTDSFGTTFKMSGAPFPISLSKFLPELIAPPRWAGLSPLESELIGFLNGYRDWPADLDRGDETLYQHAMRLWDAMRRLPGAGPLHRAAALAQGLGKVYAFEEIRTPSPWWELGKRDSVRFRRRCREHGGMAAFILATMPGFAQLGDSPTQTRERQRALLTALRYHHAPNTLPTNAGPLARELMDYLHRARRGAAQAGTTAHTAPDANTLAQLKTIVTDHAASFVDDVLLASDGAFPSNAEAVLMPNGALLMRLESLMARLAGLLPPEMRDALNLWDFGAGPAHPAWPHVRTALVQAGTLTLQWDDMQSANGTFTFMLAFATGTQRVEHMVVLTPPAPLKQKMLDQQAASVFTGLALVQTPPDQMKVEFTHHANAVGLRLAELG
jgi:hypothetical protein